MFRQVVATILRLASANADHWLPIRGSHEVPAYGFERLMEAPPLEVNTARLLTEYHHGAVAVGASWAEMLAPATLETVTTLAAEAGAAVADAERRLGPAFAHGGPGGLTTDQMSDALAGFHFPDDCWARVVYDLILVARREPASIERFVAALVPIYFGRVGSFVIANRGLGAEQAEEHVEHQAREFELLKPYVVERWVAAAGQPEVGS
jgi:hypothetical protein